MTTRLAPPSGSEPVAERRAGTQGRSFPEPLAGSHPWALSLPSPASGDHNSCLYSVPGAGP